MIALIKKDILFNLKWFVLFLIIAAAMPLLYVLDSETRLTLIVFILGPMLANSMFLPKTCYSDDSPHTKAFLFALPITRRSLVGSKYLLGILCIILSLTLTSISTLLFGLTLSIQSLAISMIYLLLYYAVFLASFYKTNYSNAEKSNAALLVLAMFSLFFFSRSGVALDEIHINPLHLMTMLLACMRFFLSSFVYSARKYHR
ncbi:MAG: ABC-2 transporter permease [Clostridia bacterium]